MVHDDEEISPEEEAAVARSKEWFEHNEGIPFEQVVSDLGFSMDQIRAKARKEPGRLKRIIFSEEAKSDLRDIRNTSR